jgi:hypothetical protein
VRLSNAPIRRRRSPWHLRQSLQEPITGLERVQSEGTSSVSVNSPLSLPFPIHKPALPTARFFPPVSFSSTAICLPELAIILPVPSIPTTPTSKSMSPPTSIFAPVPQSPRTSCLSRKNQVATYAPSKAAPRVVFCRFLSAHPGVLRPAIGSRTSSSVSSALL